MPEGLWPLRDGEVEEGRVGLAGLADAHDPRRFGFVAAQVHHLSRCGQARAAGRPLVGRRHRRSIDCRRGRAASREPVATGRAPKPRRQHGRPIGSRWSGVAPQYRSPCSNRSRLPTAHAARPRRIGFRHRGAPRTQDIGTRTRGAPLSSTLSISVVVPVHGNFQFLPAALASIRDQSFDGCEIIVVDDGSRTPVEPLVRATLPEATVLRQANAGPSAARNLGIRHATGDFVAFLDADDVWTGNALARLADGFRQAPTADVVQGYVRRFAADADAPPEPERGLGQAYLGFNVGALMARRDALLAIGSFDESLRQSEDVDLFIRMQEHRVRRLVVPHVILKYRQHPTSLNATTPPRPLARGAADNWIRLLHQSRERRQAGETRPAASPEVRARPPISVVMAVRDGRSYLPAALHCIRRQTLAPAEIVAVVGPSTDGTLDFLQAQDDVRVLTQAEAGLAGARNQGVEAARSDLIAFLDHDDLWHPRKLAAQAAVLALFTQPATCITNFRTVHDADGTDPAQIIVPRHQIPRMGWTPSALMAHRDVFGSVGRFDPALGIGCDTDWFRRLRLAGIPCGVATPVLLNKRLHAQNLSRSTDRNRAAMFRMIEKHRAETRDK
ncbi:MAG: glycosyltransferase family 2 protein [Xanthobacteraceae bacterium]|nr:glycosyltransferase family 2 protein [Xanthobacteraceae bacterium]